jgi:hypothetical protein
MKGQNDKTKIRGGRAGLHLWIVDVKGGLDSQYFEISVLRSNNEHGIRSYGWFGPDKILISEGDSNSITASVWKKLIRVAYEIANELNNITKTKL